MKKIKIIAIFCILLTCLFLSVCGNKNDNNDNDDDTTFLPSQYKGELLILQAFGGGESGANGASHSFVELYNTKEQEINLNGIYLYYANGHRDTDEGFSDEADKPWVKIDLNGKIPAKGSYLILGPKKSNGARYQIAANYGDINDEDFVLYNRAFKVALIEGDAELTVQNPFEKINGYIDMVGAANNYLLEDSIYGFETYPARCSGSEAVRRKNLTDTDDNSFDFIAARYASGGMTMEMREVRKPRNSTDTASGWNPFEEPAAPVVPPIAEALMILQANTYGNDNGRPNSPTGGGFARSIVELYNNSDISINLNTGNYYLHIGNNTEWTNVIKLTGTILANSSYLIVDNTEPATTGNTGNSNATPRATLPTADQSAAFVLVNNGFRIVLMKNQSALLSVANPSVETSLFNDYIDMLGAGNTNTAGFEAERADQSRPQGPRRKSLDDTNNNKADFAQADFRGRQGSSGVDDNQLFKIWPRNSAAGAWDPITGLPEVHPAIPSP